MAVDDTCTFSIVLFDTGNAPGSPVTGAFGVSTLSLSPALLPSALTSPVIQ